MGGGGGQGAPGPCGGQAVPGVSPPLEPLGNCRVFPLRAGEGEQGTQNKVDKGGERASVARVMDQATQLCVAITMEHLIFVCNQGFSWVRGSNNHELPRISAIFKTTNSANEIFHS